MGQWYLQRSNLVSLQQSWGLTGIWIVRQCACNIHPPTHNSSASTSDMESVLFSRRNFCRWKSHFSALLGIKELQIWHTSNGWISLRQYTQGVWVQRWKLYPAVQTESRLKKNNRDDTPKTAKTSSRSKKKTESACPDWAKGSLGKPKDWTNREKGKRQRRSERKVSNIQLKWGLSGVKMKFANLPYMHLLR